MKSLTKFLTEGKHIDDNLAKQIVNDAISQSNKKIDKQLIYKAFDKCDYDMNVLMGLLDKPSLSKELEHTQMLLDIIWDYIEDNYSGMDATSYNEYITKNLDKFI